MDLGGIFSNWGRWSDDPARNMAANQAVNLFGARMLSGSGSGKNFSSILGDAIAGAQGGFNDSLNDSSRRAYVASQVRDQEAMAEYRRAQVAEMLRKAQREAEIARMRAAAYSGQRPALDLGMAQALGRQSAYNPEAGLVATPGTPDASLRPSDALTSVPSNGPSLDDLRALAGAGALDPKDLDLWKAQNVPTSTPAGAYASFAGQPPVYMAKPGEPSIDASGRVFNPPGTEASVAGIAGAQEGAKQAAQTMHSFAQAHGRASGTRAGEAPYQLVDVPQPDGTVLKVPLSTVLQIGAQGGQRAPSGEGVVSGTPTPTAQRNQAVEQFNQRWVTNTLPEVQKQGVVARSTLNQMEALSRLNLNTGFGAGVIATIGNVLTSLGVAPGQLKDFTTSAQVFEKFANDGVLLAQIAQAGPQTESDARRMQATLPQLGNTSAANALIVAYIRAGAQLQVSRADFYTRAFDRYSREGVGTVQQIDDAWARSSLSLWDMPAMADWERRYPREKGPMAEVPR